MMGIATIGIREIASCRSNYNKLSQKFSSIIVLNVIATVLSLICLIIATMTIPELKQYKEMMYVGALKLIFNTFLIEWFYKGLEDFKYITFRSIIVRCIYVLSVYLFIKNSSDYIVYYFLTVGTIIINAIINTFHVKRFIKFQIRRIDIRPLIKPFFILGIYTLLTSMYTTFNVTYLGFTCGETAVGYYSTSTKLYSIIIAIFTAYTSVMMPRMTSLLSEGKKDEFNTKYSISCEILIAFSIPAIIFFEVLTPSIVLLISGPGYEGAITPMRIILPLILIIGYEQILVIQMLMPLKQDKVIMRNSMIAGIASIALNIILVPHLAAVGSAVIWVTCEIIIMVFSIVALTKIINCRFPIKHAVHIILIYIPLGVVIWLFNKSISNYLNVLLISGVTTVVYFLSIYIFMFPQSFCGKQIRKTFNFVKRG